MIYEAEDQMKILCPIPPWKLTLLGLNMTLMSKIRGLSQEQAQWLTPKMEIIEAEHYGERSNNEEIVPLETCINEPANDNTP